jgi:hypothetical protein
MTLNSSPFLRMLPPTNAFNPQPLKNPKLSSAAALPELLPCLKKGERLGQRHAVRCVGRRDEQPNGDDDADDCNILDDASHEA